jgi:single-strand DNA-binding protein
MNFNRAIIVGRLTNTPEAKSLPSGQQVVNFSMATNRVFKDNSGNKRETAEFHNIVAFGKLADICARYMQKGSIALIEGRIQTRSWQAQDGSKRYRTEIVAENLQLGPRAGGAGRSSSPAPAKKDDDIPVIDQEAPISTDEENQNQEDINVDNIPF